MPGLLDRRVEASRGVGLSELPSGTVTFLFTDLEGSTRLWEEHPERDARALARHDAILRDAVDGARRLMWSRRRVTGSTRCSRRAHDAVDGGGCDAQLALGASRGTGDGPLRVRMGLHTGEAETATATTYGSAVNRAARLMSGGARRSDRGVDGDE